MELQQPVARPAHGDAVLALHIHLDGVTIVDHCAVAGHVVELHRFSRPLQGAAVFNVDGRLAFADGADVEVGFEFGPGLRAVFTVIGPVHIAAMGIGCGRCRYRGDLDRLPMAHHCCGACRFSGHRRWCAIACRFAADNDGELLFGRYCGSQGLAQLIPHFFGAGGAGGANVGGRLFGCCLGCGGRVVGQGLARAKRHASQKQCA